MPQWVEVVVSDSAQVLSLTDPFTRSGNNLIVSLGTGSETINFGALAWDNTVLGDLASLDTVGHAQINVGGDAASDGDVLTYNQGELSWDAPDVSSTNLRSRLAALTGAITIGTTGSSINVTGGNSTQWNQAYAWGDHASEGYMSSWAIEDDDGDSVSISNGEAIKIEGNASSGITTNINTLNGNVLGIGLSLANWGFLLNSTTISGSSQAVLSTGRATLSDIKLSYFNDDILPTFAGTNNITTVGIIGAGTWQGTSISTTYTDAKCTVTWPNTYSANQNLNTTNAVTFNQVTAVNTIKSTEFIFTDSGGTSRYKMYYDETTKSLRTEEI